MDTEDTQHIDPGTHGSVLTYRLLRNLPIPILLVYEVVATRVT